MREISHFPELRAVATRRDQLPLKVPVSPNFALVLGSGGVRSIAALGMVEVLWREGLRPDLVVGCSAGAMFGALIACGRTAQEAVRIATKLWSSEVTRQRRWLAVVQMLMPRLGRFDEDFAMPYLVDAGRRATEEKLPQIMAMLDQAPQLVAA